MIIENLTTLKINNLTQEQYNAALAAGTINENEIYATPDDNELNTTTFLRVSDVGSAVDTNPINADTLGGKPASKFLTVDSTINANTFSNKNLEDFVLKNEIIDNLNSTDTAKPLSANQGKALKTEIDAKAPLASPAFTGSATVAAGTDYTTAKLRNVILSTADPSGGNNGDIWIKYKA